MNKVCMRLALPLVLLGSAPAWAQPGLPTPGPGEHLEDFARRVAVPPASRESSLVTPVTWNGQPFLFVDYSIVQPIPGGEQEEDRELVALEKMPGGGYRQRKVTTGEEEGGTAKIEAIAFANADKDPAKELIVLLSWPVQHADVSGTLYEVRIFDDVPPDAAQVTYLKSLSAHFNRHSCECDRDGEKPEHADFKTVAAIKRELAKMGF
ncbi:MAG: hypothetical protein JWP16_2086 [Alphaproteobacteria bacterium]|nr:hypothetical protein [Alphaproteobacteria bacterium]MDB5741046.1 hypothetical protein [Alphaproteobacteria bacterium]